MSIQEPSSSPNLRTKKATTEMFHDIQARLAQELRVSTRGVTADILIAAALTVAKNHWSELVTEVQALRNARKKAV